jgi:hypothetical protein
LYDVELCNSNSGSVLRFFGRSVALDLLHMVEHCGRMSAEKK